MNGRLADFFFVGLGIAPVALMLGGLLELALLLLVPLLFVACVFGMSEQLEEEGSGNAGGPGADPPTRDTPGFTYRKSDGVRRKA